MNTAFLQNKEIPLKLLLPVIQERLAEGKSVRISPKGASMLPMLRPGKDSVVLSPLPDKLKKYDLPLYRRTDGQFVLHRIVRAGDTYTCIGDNQFQLECDVQPGQMIALVTAFYRAGKRCSVKSPAYWLYCRCWHYSRGIRHFVQRGWAWIGRKIK